jgi:hypothetical protein
MDTTQSTPVSQPTTQPMVGGNGGAGTFYIGLNTEFA